jgi:hypothetical protein
MDLFPQRYAFSRSQTSFWGTEMPWSDVARAIGAIVDTAFNSQVIHRLVVLHRETQSRYAVPEFSKITTYGGFVLITRDTERRFCPLY